MYLSSIIVLIRTDKMMVGSWDSFNIVMDNMVSKAMENDIVDIMMDQEAIQHNSNMTLNIHRYREG